MRLRDECNKKWDNEHAQFWDRLLRQRAAQIAGDPAWLKSVRYDVKEAEVLQRRFGYVWKESGTNIYKLIASAFGETWDEEDDQKNAERVGAGPVLGCARRLPLVEEGRHLLRQRVVAVVGHALWCYDGITISHDAQLADIS